LNDHFGDSEPIRGTELANMVAWRNAERPNAAWLRAMVAIIATSSNFSKTASCGGEDLRR
jgi:hypothetical protein